MRKIETGVDISSVSSCDPIVNNVSVDAMIFYNSYVDQHRLRERTVDELSVARVLLSEHYKNKNFRIRVGHGGGVANKYGYPAESTAVACTKDPNNNVIINMTRIPANKITYAGTVAACLGEDARPIFDERYGEEKTKVAQKTLRRTHCEQLKSLSAPDVIVINGQFFKLTPLDYRIKD